MISSASRSKDLNAVWLSRRLPISPERMRLKKTG
jgi:hypothetical protein